MSSDVPQPAYILVDGPFQSGKSAFLATISEQPVVSAEPASRRSGRGNVLDYGLIRLDADSAVYLLATAGGLRFDPRLELPDLPMTLLGVVLLVDSTRTMTFEEARGRLHLYRSAFREPCVVAANHQDRPNALGPEDVRAALAAPPEVPVVGCVATDSDSVTRVLIALLHVVVARIEDM